MHKLNDFYFKDNVTAIGEFTVEESINAASKPRRATYKLIKDIQDFVMGIYVKDENDKEIYSKIFTDEYINNVAINTHLLILIKTSNKLCGVASSSLIFDPKGYDIIMLKFSMISNDINEGMKILNILNCRLIIKSTLLFFFRKIYKS